MTEIVAAPFLAQEEESGLRTFFQTTDVLLFGMSGSGKTTTVRSLQSFVPIRYVSVGEITRAQIQFGKENQIQGLIRKGGKWPLEIIQGIIEPYMNLPTPCVIDGIPKYHDEASWLLDRLRQRDNHLATVTLHLSVDEAQRRQAERDNTGRLETMDQFTERHAVYARHHATIMDILSPALDQSIELDASASPSEIVCMMAREIMNNGGQR